SSSRGDWIRTNDLLNPIQAVAGWKVARASRFTAYKSHMEPANSTDSSEFPAASCILSCTAPRLFSHWPIRRKLDGLCLYLISAPSAVRAESSACRPADAV